MPVMSKRGAKPDPQIRPAPPFSPEPMTRLTITRSVPAVGGLVGWPSDRSVGLWVCGSVGLWVCWFVGLLVCWFVGLLVKNCSVHLPEPAGLLYTARSDEEPSSR